MPGDKSKNIITIHLRSDIIEYIQHEMEIMTLNEVKQFKLIMNGSNVVMEWFSWFGTGSFDQ